MTHALANALAHMSQPPKMKHCGSMLMVLGKQWPKTVDIVGDMVQNLRGFRYEFASEGEFQRAAMAGGVTSVNRIYWTEFLERAHWAAAASLTRNYRWLQAVAIQIADGNFLGFSACYRGWLESVADSYDALGALPNTLTDHFQDISRAIAGALRTPLVSGELEDALIHFAFARQVRKGEKVPDGHRRKPQAEYVSQLQGANERALSCYHSLCEIAHPSASSLLWFTDVSDSAVVLGEPDDAKHIDRFCRDYEDVSRWLGFIGFNYPLITLKLLNAFALRMLHTRGMEKVNLTKIPAWRKIEGKVVLRPPRLLPGRNDPCYCRSGAKFKKCHGQ